VSELIPITFHKVMQTRAYTVVIMEANEKRFPIYVDPSIGKAIQEELTENKSPRPQTHDLLNMILKGLDVKIKQIVITDLQDTIYYARLFLEGPSKEEEAHVIEIDVRPSDCITLAIMNNSPVYCTQEVLDNTILVDEF
jgi:uncharacterized protein